MAGLSEINKKVLAGVLHAGSVVGVAVGEGFDAVGEGFGILHENAKHVGAQTINASKSILESLESTLDGRAPEGENSRPLLPPEVELLENLQNLQPLLPPEVEPQENLQNPKNPSSKPSSQILM